MLTISNSLCISKLVILSKLVQPSQTFFKNTIPTALILHLRFLVIAQLPLSFNNIGLAIVLYSGSVYLLNLFFSALSIVPRIILNLLVLFRISLS